MVRMRKFGSAVILAAMIAAVPFNAAGAGPKKPPSDDGRAATCAYLWNVITYPYVSPAIAAAALSLYISYGCTRQ